MPQPDHHAEADDVDGDQMYRLFAAAQVAAFNRVLAYLNTLEDRMVDKGVIYRRVFSMMPHDEENDDMFRRSADLTRNR